jgi:hypothetical protein
MVTRKAWAARGRRGRAIRGDLPIRTRNRVSELLFLMDTVYARLGFAIHARPLGECRGGT